ncbi:hypothetical protein [Microbacterium sp.]|uniref:hypothetical protein n=1 Tax=Microbacterium sp. TaxID=51671 RepID=UPI003A8B62C6
MDALNAVDLADPATFEPVFDLSTGRAYEADRVGLSEMHAEHLTVSGESIIAVSERGSASSDLTEVFLSICLDVSRVELTDVQGRSAVDPDRTPVQSLTVGFVPSASSSHGAQVHVITAREGKPLCVSG